jgi:hypothetical protein
LSLFFLHGPHYFLFSLLFSPHVCFSHSSQGDDCSGNEDSGDDEDFRPSPSSKAKQYDNRDRSKQQKQSRSPKSRGQLLFVLRRDSLVLMCLICLGRGSTTSGGTGTRKRTREAESKQDDPSVPSARPLPQQPIFATSPNKSRSASRGNNSTDRLTANAQEVVVRIVQISAGSSYGEWPCKAIVVSQGSESARNGRIREGSFVSVSITGDKNNPNGDCFAKSLFKGSCVKISNGWINQGGTLRLP